MDGVLEEVCEFLRMKAEDVSVVVMPDFFLDRLIELDCGEREFFRNVEKVAEKSGGSIDGVKQTDIRGGNAANTASALATLGVNVTPIVSTSDFGLKLLEAYLEPFRLDLTRTKIRAAPSITTAIEFKAARGKTNVMIRDVGSLADFGPRDLDAKDFEAIEEADYVCVFNWAGTRKHGTELAKTVFERVKTKGRGKCYYDTADPTTNRPQIAQLVQGVLRGQCVDILSVNENEAVCYASQSDGGSRVFERDWSLAGKAEASAGLLGSRFSARVDLHAADFSATFRRGKETVVPTFDVRVLRVTGAGDAWNAGNIVGDAGDLSDEARLMLANAVAAYYISSPNGTHPTREQLLDFCKKAKLRKPQSKRHA